MNVEIVSPRRRPNQDNESNASPGTYFPSTNTVNDNPSLPADFVILCPSPELNIFETKRAIKNRSGSHNSRSVYTGETIHNLDNDLGSLHSFELWNYDPKFTRAMSLPKERRDSDSDLDIKSNKSLGNNLILKLKSLATVDDMIHKAEELNNKLHEQVKAPLKQRKEAKNMFGLAVDAENVEKSSNNGCNCKKSKCLRLHCICFADSKECGEGCKCLDCKNNPQFKEMRDFVIEKTKEINPLAFKPKIKNFMGKNVNSRGCNCSKNSCLKRYCECFKSGSGCTELCTCDQCKNTKAQLTDNDIADIRDKGYRRKHKIVINAPALEKRDAMDADENAVTFIKHKKKRRSRAKL